MTETTPTTFTDDDRSRLEAVVYPSDPAARARLSTGALVERRGAAVVFTLAPEEETPLIRWLGMASDQQPGDADTVPGFQVLRETEGEVVLSIPRPVLMMQML